MAHDIIISRHGRKRLQQRGIPSRILNLVIENSDVAFHAGGGLETVRLSRRAALAMAASGDIAPNDAIRASRIAIVLGGEKLITALHPSGHRGRCYRRQATTRATRARGIAQ